MRKKSNSNDIHEARVKLKPVFGIKPGTYLTVIYTCILIFVLYIMLFYPGIRRRGTYIRINTFPPGASVLVDGIYAGSTPCEILVKMGRRKIIVKKPFYKTEEIQDLFGGRIFVTLFFPPRAVYEIRLKVEDRASLLSHSLSNFAANPHIPEILTETVYALYNQSEQTFKEEMFTFLDNAKYFVSNTYQVNELVHALSMLEADVQILTPSGMIGIVNKIIQVKEKYDTFPLWLILVLPDYLANKLTETDWLKSTYMSYASHYRKWISSPGTEHKIPHSSDAYRISGLNFLSVPGGTLIKGKFNENVINPLLVHPVLIDPFIISETEVPNILFKKFLDENPYWKKSNLDKLLKENLVSETYLSSWGDIYPTDEDKLPVVNVSFHAALAFCQWFNGQAFSILSGYEARLPYESEWEWAARGGLKEMPYPLGNSPGNACFFKKGIDGPQKVGSTEANGYRLKDMSGNVWEWCLDWYSPVGYLFSSWHAEKNSIRNTDLVPQGSEKVIRGGAWANEKELLKLHVRGSQPPSWCTPYLGFRIVLSRRTL